MIHTNPLGAAQDSWLYTFTYTILRNALPFFFLSSSYFFFKKRNWSKYIKRLFILYFSWFVLLFVYVIYIKFYSAPGPWEMKLLSFCKDLIWNGALPGAWYVVASLHSVVLLYFLSLKLKFNNTALIVVGVCLYCVSLLNSTYYGFAADNECLMVMNQVLSIVMPSPAHSFFSAFIFFVIGKIIAENQHRAKLRYYVIGLIGFGILEFVETGLLYHFNLIKENDYYFNKSVDRHINLTNRLLRRFCRGLSNDLENVRNSLLCVSILSRDPFQIQRYEFSLNLQKYSVQVLYKTKARGYEPRTFFPFISCYHVGWFRRRVAIRLKGFSANYEK